MQQFLLRRVGLALLALFGLSILTFLFMYSTPLGHIYPIDYDPEWERAKTALHFQLESKVNGGPSQHSVPILSEYIYYMDRVLSGDWGKSGKWDTDAMSLTLARISTTFGMAALALAGGALVGVGLGILAAVNNGSSLCRFSNTVIRFAQSMPIFCLGIVVMWVYIFISGSVPNFADGEFFPIILPAITLAWLPAAILGKLTQIAMMSALKSDYVKLARIKGLSEWKIIWNHCLRNVAVSPLFSFGLIGGAALTSLVLTEAALNWPGVGLLAIESFQSHDRMVLHGVVLFLGGAFILCHLAADVLRALLDPRIRHSERTHIQYQL